MTHMLQKVADDFPVQFAQGIPAGRYAWHAAGGEPLQFIWIKDYKSGKRNGQRRIRTQHGPWYEDAVTFHPTGKISLWKPQIAEVLVGVGCDIQNCAKTYARELGVCFRCNSELTDDRSRYYGCGPECEKIVPWYFEEIDNEADGTYEELLALGRIVDGRLVS